ncbi:hypothetical protein MYAM1_001565 [Malassezia yamatoensis]|uniref:Proteasome assembly chaperone 1 n=1 Tax=Malassezia yamatoensis TaxID=253288 RepID=A0AAJ6CG00_9BASI|nr:hypothetical protein MYAM1_001565 [Malassezia yamatoensis]
MSQGDAEGRAPRHAYESEDEGDEDMLQDPVRPVRITREPMPIPNMDLSGRPVIVLLGTIGAAILAAWQGQQTNWKVSYTYSLDEFPIAYVSIASESKGTTLLLIPEPQSMRADQCAPLVREMMDDLKPKSLVAITTYHPHQYISLSSSDHQDPIRYLCCTPHDTSLPADSGFTVSSQPSFAPWELPNTITGLAAALLAQCKTLSVPGILHLAPTSAAWHSSVGWTAAHRVLPYEVQRMTEAEAIQKLRSHTWDVRDELVNTLSKLLPVSQAASIDLRDPHKNSEFMCQVAAQSMCALRSQQHAGTVGDGGMYL